MIFPWQQHYLQWISWLWDGRYRTLQKGFAPGIVTVFGLEFWEFSRNRDTDRQKTSRAGFTPATRGGTMSRCSCPHWVSGISNPNYIKYLYLLAVDVEDDMNHIWVICSKSAQGCSKMWLSFQRPIRKNHCCHAATVAGRFTGPYGLGPMER